jgi:hypothetical protein
MFGAMGSPSFESVVRLKRRLAWPWMPFSRIKRSTRFLRVRNRRSPTAVRWADRSVVPVEPTCAFIHRLDKNGRSLPPAARHTSCCEDNVTFSGRSSWPVPLLFFALLGCGSTAAPIDTDPAIRGDAGGDGRPGSGGSPGQSSSGGDGTGADSCDCGDDASDAHLSLQCACAHGLCSTFAEDKARPTFALPYYFRLGICAAGYRTLTYKEATEQSRTSTYDADGNLVYASYAGYYNPPAACAFERESGLGRVTIGEADPAEMCEYCILAAEDPHGYYPDSSGPKCTAEQLR